MANEIANFRDGSPMIDVGQPLLRCATPHANWPFLMGRWSSLGRSADRAGNRLWRNGRRRRLRARSPTYESEAVLIVNPSLVFAQDHFDTLQFSEVSLRSSKAGRARGRARRRTG